MSNDNFKKELFIAKRLTQHVSNSFPILQDLDCVDMCVAVNDNGQVIGLDMRGYNNKHISSEIARQFEKWFSANKGIVLEDILRTELEKEIIPGVTLNHLVEEEMLKNV
jgi:hypothetical protein